MKTYEQRKEEAREEAKQWQYELSEKVYSWEDLAEAGAHFEKLARRYGLTAEFKENGII